MELKKEFWVELGWKWLLKEVASVSSWESKTQIEAQKYNIERSKISERRDFFEFDFESSTKKNHFELYFKFLQFQMSVWIRNLWVYIYVDCRCRELEKNAFKIKTKKFWDEFRVEIFLRLFNSKSSTKHILSLILSWENLKSLFFEFHFFIAKERELL